MNEKHILCKHTFVDDLIDLDPEHSKMVTYCTKCYVTQKVNDSTMLKSKNDKKPSKSKN